MIALVVDTGARIGFTAAGVVLVVLSVAALIGRRLERAAAVSEETNP